MQAFAFSASRKKRPKQRISPPASGPQAEALHLAGLAAVFGETHAFHARDARSASGHDSKRQPSGKLTVNDVPLFSSELTDTRPPAPWRLP